MIDKRWFNFLRNEKKRKTAALVLAVISLPILMGLTNIGAQLASFIIEKMINVLVYIASLL